MAVKKSIKENKKLINEDGYFKVSLDTFLYNAGIVGFIEVLEKAEAKEGKDKDYYIKGQDLSIKKEFLKSPNLAQAYIDSICDKFRNETFFEKIKNEKSCEKEIKKICEEYEPNKKGNDTKIKGGKYRQAIKKIGLSKEYDYETELIKLPYNERIEKVKIILNDIEKDKKLKSILDFNSVSGKITAFWGQFAFLDYANTSDYKLTDIIEKYFTNSINKIALDKREENIEDYCFMCSNPIYDDYVYESLGQKKKGSSNNEKELKTKPYSTSFINGLTQDLEGKSSQFWNHNPDVRICPLCAFIYACVPIGFINTKNSFVFINKNDSINFLIDENKSYEYKLLKSKGDNLNYFNTYIQNKIEKNEKEIEGIEFVINEYNDNKYRYVIKNIDKNVLHILKASKIYLSELYGNNIKCSFDNKTSLDAFNECLENIFRNVNQYNLLYKIYMAKYPDKIRFNDIIKALYLILRIQIIKNSIFTKGDKNMNDMIQKGEEACKQGFILRMYIAESIDKKVYSQEVTDKIKGMSFKLVNSVQTCNFNLFRDILFHTYIALGKNIPNIIMDMRESKDIFKDLGYSYLAGFNGAMDMKEIKDIFKDLRYSYSASSNRAYEKTDKEDK